MKNDNPIGASGEGYRNIIVLLFLGYFFSFADRIAFGLVLKPIKVALSLTDSQAGLLAGAAFAISYAVFSPLGGYFVDRRKRRPIFVFAVAFWSAATLSCSLAMSALFMGIARACVGAGEALLHPLAVSLIGDTVRPEGRPQAIAVYISAGSFGTVGVMLFGGALVHFLSGMPPIQLPLIGALLPWQALFIALAVPGAFLAVAVLLLMREPPRHGSVHGPQDKVENSVLPFMRANPRLAVAIILGFPLLQMAGYSLLSWIFVFYDRVHGWSAGKAGPTFALTGGMTFIIGCLLSGKFVQVLRRLGMIDAPLRACMIGGVGLSIFSAIGLWVPSPEWALVPFAVAFLFGYLPTIGAYSATSEVIPPRIRASLVGINTLTVGLITNSLGPFAVGFLSDHLFAGPQGIRSALVATLALSAIGGSIAVSVGFKPYRQRIAEGVETEGAQRSERASPRSTALGASHGRA